MFFVVGTAILLYQCSYNDGSVKIPVAPFEKLSDFNLFTGDLAELNPNTGVIPYDLNSPLFSDYAKKARFVWVPEGKSARYTLDHVIDFPEGSILIKNFFYNHDETDLSQGRRILETRLLINRGEEWEALTYVWNDEQTEAEYNIIGEIKAVSWVDEQGDSHSIDYIIPNKNQCKSCHAYKNQLKPVGPRVRNLNKDFAYGEGTFNQLEYWSNAGKLSGYLPSLEHPSLAVWDEAQHYSIHDRAMAYLDINCGHCHNPDGAANTSGLTLLADSELGLSLGVFKATVSAGAGTGGHTYSIVPGHPEESIMIYRMKSLNPAAMMPEIGRRMVHQEGVDLIASWIADMDSADQPNLRQVSLN